MHFDSYQPRRIHFLELWRHQDWHVKLYAISHQDKDSQQLDVLLESCKEMAQATLPTPGLSARTYGTAFMSIHQGHSYDFVTLNFWIDQSELKQHTFMRPSSSSDRLEPLNDQELAHDVWDLWLLAFEGEAWFQHVLSKAPQPDMEAYLSQTLDIVM